MESMVVKFDEEKKDRISDIPDDIIHHILSFLPSTEETVRTAILSKRWENQWTHVPVLIFDSTAFGMPLENFFQFVDNTLILHESSKINKFHLVYSYTDYDPKFSSKIRFATRKGVEELYLWLNYEYVLPKFLFKYSSLVTLSTMNCSFMPNGKVNWECLTTLGMTSCRLADDQVMDLILSGSPLLETLLLSGCFGFKKLFIASKSLIYLYLDEFREIFDIEISCTKLEVVFLGGCLNIRTAKLLNWPSLLYATIDFNHHEDECKESRMSLIKDILNKLRHVKELAIGDWFIENMSSVLQIGSPFSPVFNIDFLNLASYNTYVIAWLIRNSPVLEELIINVGLYDQAQLEDYEDFGENYWSDATVFKCLISHLKMVKIIKSDGKRKVMFKFIQCILKNARVLENIVFI